MPPSLIAKTNRRGDKRSDINLHFTEIQELKTGQELNGVDYSIIVINSAPARVPDIWPSSISERFYDLPGAEEASALDSLENEKRVAFYMATSDVHEVPKYLIRHLWEKSLQEETTWPGLIELWNSSFSDTMAEAVDKQTSSTKTASVREIVCGLPLERGTRPESSNTEAIAATVLPPTTEARFYFDNDWRVCRKFTFEGHGAGNLNNFRTEQECKEICGQDFKGTQVTSVHGQVTRPEGSEVGGQDGHLSIWTLHE